jgi:hypothetical protein
MASATPITTIDAEIRQSHGLGTEPREEILKNLEHAKSKLEEANELAAPSSTIPSSSLTQLPPLRP